MSKVPPFHSSIPQYRNVYHDDNKCPEGKKIRARNRRPGTDERPRCSHCMRLESVRHGVQRSARGSSDM